MNVVKILDAIFDGFLALGVLFILGFIWTFDFTCLQATATCGFGAGATLLLLAKYDKPEPPKPVRLPRAEPARDFVSQEEYDETPVG